MGNVMKVFVSHRHRDSAWAKSLVKQLQARGFEVWLDESKLCPGDDWAEQIRQAVRDSDTVVSVIGGHQPSPNVLVEMGMALAQGKRVLPIVIDAETDISMLSKFARLQSIRTNDAEQAAEAVATLASQESGDSV
jgi:nucleoside 2-deoxyribosyltransferase